MNEVMHPWHAHLVDRALTDLLSFIVDNRGRTCPVTDSGFPLIATNCIKPDQREAVFEGVRYVDNETYARWFRAHPLPGDVIFVCKGSPGRVAVVPDPVPYCIAQDMVALRADTNVIDPSYLYYRLSAPDVQAKIQNMHVGTLIPHFKKGDFGQLRFSVHENLDEQRRIAGVLGAVDDLIDLNVAQVASLTNLVQAEYERRFGQHDLSLTIADVATVIDCLHSKKPERVPAGKVLLQLNNILDSGLLDLADTYLIGYYDYVRWTKNLETQQWDCVITNVGRVGAVARIPADVSAALGRNMTAVRPKQPNQDGAFLIAALRSRAVRQEIELRTDAGTIMNALNVRSIPKLRLQNASTSERESFQAFAAPLLTLADSLHDESINLSRQRKELLPLLLSGQVRVKDMAA